MFTEDKIEILITVTQGLELFDSPPQHIPVYSEKKEPGTFYIHLINQRKLRCMCSAEHRGLILQKEVLES